MDRKREYRSLVKLRIRGKMIAREGDSIVTTDAALPLEEKAKKNRGFDIIYVEGDRDGIPATLNTPLGMLVRLRDEAHRFALKYHRGLRSKAAVRSDFLKIRGVGNALLGRIYQHFNGIDEIAQTGVEEIARRIKTSITVAAAIREKALRLQERKKK